MSYAVAHGVVGAGLVLAATFGLGMVATVAAFPLLAVLLRTRLMPLISRSEHWRGWIARGLEVRAAVLVLLLGFLPLIRQ
jgi:ABC-type nickel/cobalt efflux system permease component RcnA